MKKHILVLTALFTSISVYAATESSGSSQYLYQAPEGQFELTPILSYVSSKYKIHGLAPLTKLEQTGFNEGVMAEYGLTGDSSLAALVLMGTTSGKFSPGGTGMHDPGTSGMYDPKIFYNRRATVGNGTLKYGTTLWVSLEKRKVEADLDTNNVYGGWFLTPYVAYEMPVGPKCLAGVKISYDVGITKNKIEDSSSGTKVEKEDTGGETFDIAFFYEHTFNPTTKIGFAFDINATREITENAAGVDTNLHNGFTKLGYQLYVPVEVAPKITLLPAVTYGQYTATNGDYMIEPESVMQVDLAARFVF